MLNRAPYLFAEITVDHRDGCFHAYSNDVPGFHLCGDSAEALHHDVPEALEFLFKVKHNMVVKVQPAVSPRELNTVPMSKRRTAHEPKRFVMTQDFAYA